MQAIHQAQALLQVEQCWTTCQVTKKYRFLSHAQIENMHARIELPTLALSDPYMHVYTAFHTNTMPSCYPNLQACVLRHLPAETIVEVASLAAGKS